jgi:hypothetical protein
MEASDQLHPQAESPVLISCTRRQIPRCSSAAPAGGVPGAHQLHPQGESPVLISCTHRESPRCSSAAPTGRVPGAHQLHPQAESPALIEHYTGLELSLDPSTRQISAPAWNRTPYRFSSRLEPTRSSWFRFNHKPADSTRFSTHLFNVQSIVQHTTQSIHAFVINIYTFVVCFSEVKKNSSK